MVIIRAVDVKKFRGMSNVNVSLDGDVVAIAGQNGTHKTTLLGMLAQPFSLSSKDAPLHGVKTVDEVSFGSKLRDKFKFSEEFDVIGSHEWTLHLDKDICGLESYSCVSISRTKGKGYNIRFWSADKSRKKGTGYVQLPVAFLSLKRLLPIGETRGLKTNRSTTLLKNAKEIEFYKKWHNDILISTDAINSVASVKGAGKSSLAPVTSYSDAVTISAGQDNVGKIILTVLSFMRLKVDHERDYKGGLIFIDEIETSLYPAAQIQLLKFMFKVASDLSLQFFFTTHSETIIKFLKLSKYAPKARIAFLKKMGTTIVASSEQSLPQIENNLVLRSFPERDNLPDKIRVYAEDDKTFSFLSAMLPRDLISKVSAQRKVSLSAGHYKELIAKKVPEFYKSIIVLDGDKDGKADGIREREKSKFKQVIFLMAPDCPEKMLFRFFYELPDTDEFWDNEQGTYTKQICFTDFSTMPSSTDQFKTWFEQQTQYNRSAHSKMIRYWAKRNQDFVRKFREDFISAYNYVADKSGFARIEDGGPDSGPNGKHADDLLKTRDKAFRT